MSDTPTLDIDRDAFAIVATVAEYHGIAPRVLLGDNRTHRVSDLRRQACYLIHIILAPTLVQIGRALGGIDHSSVKHAISQAEVSYKADPNYANMIDAQRQVAAKTIADFRRHPIPETELQSVAAPLDIAKQIMRTPRGEIRLTGVEMRILAEAYVDELLRSRGLTQ